MKNYLVIILISIITCSWASYEIGVEVGHEAGLMQIDLENNDFPAGSDYYTKTKAELMVLLDRYATTVHKCIKQNIKMNDQNTELSDMLSNILESLSAPSKSPIVEPSPTVRYQGEI